MTVERSITDERRMAVERVMVERTTVGRKTLAGRVRRDRDAFGLRGPTQNPNMLVSAIYIKKLCICPHYEECLGKRNIQRQARLLQLPLDGKKKNIVRVCLDQKPHQTPRNNNYNQQTDLSADNNRKRRAVLFLSSSSR